MDQPFSLPGETVPIRSRSNSVSPIPEHESAWWKAQLEAELVSVHPHRQHQQQQQQPPSRGRLPPRRQSEWVGDRSDDLGSSASDDGSTVSYRQQTEMDELRDQLRAARRNLDAGERRERALRRELQRVEQLPSVGTGQRDPLPGGRASRERRRGDERHGQRQEPEAERGGAGGGVESLLTHTLGRGLMQSGLMETEQGREQVAKMLAEASRTAGSRAQQQREPPQQQQQQPPLPFARAPLPPPPSQRPHGAPPLGTPVASAPPSAPSTAHTSNALTPPAGVPPPAPRFVNQAEVSEVLSSLLDEVVQTDATRLVKDSVREVVARVMKADLARQPLESQYSSLYSSL